MNFDSKIYVTGADGLVGSAVTRELKRRGYNNVITATKWAVDLVSTQETMAFFSETKPEYVINCAANVGGIGYNNKYGADIITDNLFIQNNVIAASHNIGVKKLIFLGSSCVYPKECPQPMKEEYLMTGPLEKTNIGYSLAKIAGIVMCEEYRKQYADNFISLMPCNIYGPNDNFKDDDSHVIPAMIRKFYTAKVFGYPEVELWGTGKARRELMYVEDLADAIIFMANNYESAGLINIGTGEDDTIKDIAKIVKSVVDYEGDIIWNKNKPDGTMKKLLDNTRAAQLGWRAKTGLYEGVERTFKWYLENKQ
jgi:GDP-L-fucose synthase